MQQTSIHIKPINTASEAHNLRTKELPYVRKELTYTNESWQSDSIANRLQTIKANTKAKTGRCLQAKATPIREGVIVLDVSTRMQDIRNFATEIEKRFAIQTIQIHIHNDEGHFENGKFKKNRHAHIVFDWTNIQTGKSIKLRKQDMAEMQTILANCLHMERGVSSSIKHLSAIQYKNKREAEKQNALQKEVKELQTRAAIKKTILRGFERISDALGKTTHEKEEEALKTQINTQQRQINTQQRQINALTQENKRIQAQNKALQDDLEAKQRTLKNVLTETTQLIANLAPQAHEFIKQKYIYISQLLPKQQAPSKPKQQKQKGPHL